MLCLADNTFKFAISALPIIYEKCGPCPIKKIDMSQSFACTTRICGLVLVIKDNSIAVHEMLKGTYSKLLLAIYEELNSTHKQNSFSQFASIE